MTFTEIQTQVSEDLNLTATAAITRIGRQINIRYKRIVSSLGLDTSTRTTSTQSSVAGTPEVTFTSIDKITRIADITGGTVKLLKEVMWDELREKSPADSDSVTSYAIKRVNATSVVVTFDVNFQSTAVSLRADGYETTSTLSGSNVPAFPEDFHDILVWGAKADELLKMEKAPLAKYCEDMAARRLSELRLYLAKTNYLDNRQTARPSNASTASTGGGGGASTMGEANYTQTGLITFDRDPLAPFAVTSGSAKVTNLDADLLDGLDSTAFALASAAAPINADYLVKTANATLTAERVVTDNTDITADWSVAGVVKFLLGAFTGDITKAAGSLATAIGVNKVLNTMFRQSGALAVVGRSANSTGDVADIQATAATDAVLRESGSVIGFGTIVAGGIASNAVTTAKILDANVTLAKIANAAANSKLVGSGAAGSGAAYSEITLGSGLTMTGTTLSAAGSTSKPFLQWSPLGNTPPATIYATPDTRNSHPTLDFDGAADEEAVFNGVLPVGYAAGGLTVETFWAFTSATSGSLRVQAGIERIDASSLDIDADSFAAFQSAGGTAPGTSGQVIKVTITFTDGAQMDSLAAGEAFRLKIRRDADGTSGTDDIVTDAELLHIVMRET